MTMAPRPGDEDVLHLAEAAADQHLVDVDAHPDEKTRRKHAVTRLPRGLRGKAFLNGDHAHAARKSLGWSAAELAAKAGVSLLVVHCIERDQFVPVSKMRAVRAALESAGVEFTDGGQAGVTLKKDQVASS